MTKAPQDISTERLDLCLPSAGDCEELFELSSDPRVWTHYPSLRPTQPARTRASIELWLQGWKSWGLDTWTVRLKGSSEVIGYGGCSVKDSVWNLGYRLSAEVQGRGYATELARAALEQAAEVDPERPVVAYLVEHNVGSRRVAEKMGMSLAYRAFDVNNPDPSAVRLIFSDRILSAAQLAELTGGH